MAFKTVEVKDTDCRKGGGNRMPKTKENTNETKEEDTTSMLVGYVRRSGAGGALKVSIDIEAIQACSTYTTSDGRAYAPLVISLRALQRVLEGERAVTTISQLVD
ncbi:MAG: hypothetical protein L7U48_04950 [Candidatus Poseidoniaceae archaeon]|nr:hypothetical protein [Candidatus Poseidoniaceae archaeon]